MSTIKNVAKMLGSMPTELRWFGDPVLRTVSTPFSQDEFDNGSVLDVSNKLMSVLQTIRREMNIGRGLAAPQIGISRRIFITHNAADDSFESYVNPVIRSSSDTRGVYKEMCLSGLPLSGSVVRPWEIELEYCDVNGQQTKSAVDPLVSRVAQHEIDHLDGILFTDRADPKSLSFEFDWEKFRAGNQLVKIDKM